MMSITTRPDTQPVPLPASQSRGLRLCVAMTLLCVVWLGILPAISRIPAQARYERWLEERKIDPSAMFYTELEMMPPLQSFRDRPSTGPDHQ